MHHMIITYFARTRTKAANIVHGEWCVILLMDLECLFSLSLAVHALYMICNKTEEV